jgi:ATP-dependent DNA helicase RecG
MENGSIKRAAALMFHETPEQYVFGAGIKIAYFSSEADIVYQDEITGSLVSIADRTEEIVYSKYFKGLISYKGLQRIENFPVPRPAFREAILNAIINKDYAALNPIHIRIYDEKVEIYNSGKLPSGWTVEHLKEEHDSKPFNPFIANAMFRSGQVESWGRGIRKINDSLKMFGKKEVEHKVGGGYLVTIFDTRGEPEGITDRGRHTNAAEGITEGITEGIKLSAIETAVLELLKRDNRLTVQMIAQATDKSISTIERTIDALKKNGLIKRIGSKKSGHWEVLK